MSSGAALCCALGLIAFFAPPSFAQVAGGSAGSAGAPPGAAPQAAPGGGLERPTPNEAAGLTALGKALSSPELPPGEPATPHRLALMQQYMQAANLPQVMKAVAALEYQQARSQALSSARALPRAQQAVVLADFDRAFDAAERDKQQKIMSAMADYYARRMSDDELEKAVAFYSSGLGLKVLRDGQHLTPDERQELGRDVLASPALQTFSKLNFDYLRRVAAARAADTAVFQADFRANLCRNLAASHIRSSACVASRP